MPGGEEDKLAVSIRTSIILVVSLAMVAGWVFFVQLNKTPEVEEEPPWFYNVDMFDLARISIQDEGEEAVFFLGDDGTWHLDAPDGLPVGRDRWGGVTLLVSGPKVRRELVDAQPADIEQYGLVSPSSRIDIDLKDGESINVLLGLLTPDGQNVYAQVDGFPQVFTVFSGWEESLTSLITEPPYPEWYYNVEPATVTQIDLIAKVGPVFLIKDGDGWRFNDEEQSAVDETKMPSLLASLEKPAQTYVADFPADLAQYGLDEPLLSLFVEVERPDEEGFTVISQARFVVGGLTEDGTAYYAQTQRGEFAIPDVFKIDAGWVEGIQAIADNPPYLDEPA